MIQAVQTVHIIYYCTTSLSRRPTATVKLDTPSLSNADLVFHSQINNIYIFSLCLSYTIVTLKRPPCHDKLTIIAPRKKSTEFIFRETGPGEGVQFQKPVKRFMNFISSKLTPMDGI
jgi:hypothetical protein